MKLAALYDIHGNVPALEAVLKECKMAGVDRLIIGGDVLVGPMSATCLDLLNAFEIPSSFIMGNCDEAVIELRKYGKTSKVPARVIDNVTFSARELTDAQIEEVSKWPLTIRMSLENIGEVLFCHATPENNTDIFTIRTPEKDLIERFNLDGVDLVVCGHTHMQFDRQVGSTRIVNAGSVGMPFGLRGANWLLFDNGLQFKHTTYHYDLAAKVIQTSSYPDKDNFIQNHISSFLPVETVLDGLSKIKLG